MTLLYWDMKTNMPKLGLKGHVDALTHFSTEHFAMTISEELSTLLDALTASEELGSVDVLLAAGNIGAITKWLNEKIHPYGSTRTPKEVMRMFCKKEVSAQPLIWYFKEKYSQVYEL